MIGFIETFLSFVLVLGILVFVHEFGHFIVAKAFGIDVMVFSLGFGKRLFGFKRKETDYKVCLIPLGGYVKLAGDETDDNRTGDPREFLSRPRWQRFLVYVAGATFNIILALVVTWIVLWVWGTYEARSPESYPVIVAFADGSTAEAGGFRVGDTVISIGGLDAREIDTFRDEVLLSPGTTKSVVIERDGERVTRSLDTGSDPRYHLGSPGWSFYTDPPLITQVNKDTPAEAAGILEGDRILGVGEREPIGELEFREILASSPGVAVDLKIDRGGEMVEVTVVPAEQDGRGLIGVLVQSGSYVHRELTATEAAVESWRLNLELTKTVFVTLDRMLRGDISMRALSGPIEIARVSRQAVEGLRSLLGFLAFISLQLGILNLLPIPILDGGHILILGLEGTLRRDLSMRIKERVMQVGLVLLLVFFGFVIYFDVIKTFFTS